jgi:lysyl-tRNA synthetase class 2
MRPEKKAIELTEEEKLIVGLLKANSPIELPSLKEQAGLSNKKWDVSIKGLTKKGIAKVEKTEEGLFVTAL